MPYLLPLEQRPDWDTFYFYNDVFTAEECEKIIAMGKSYPADQATLKGGSVDNNKRKAKLVWMPWDEESDWIYAKLSGVVIHANLTRFKFDISAFLEPLQFTQYLEPNDHHGWHQDLGSGEISARKLSLIVQLSDESSYEGGDLQFFMLKDRPHIRKMGTVFVFPSYEVHRITPLLKGERYSLVSWVSGPPFR